MPYHVPLEVGRSRLLEDGAWKEYVPLDPYEELDNLSFPPTCFFIEWDLQDVDELNMARALHWITCLSLNAWNLPPRVPDAVTARCFSNVTIQFNFSYYYLKTECLLASVGEDATASSIVRDISLFIAIDVQKVTADGANFTYLPGTEWESRTTSYPRVDVNVSFMLLSTNAFRNFMFGIHAYQYFRNNLPAGQSVLGPFELKVVHGKCEQTLPSMGFSALLQTAYEKWKIPH